MNRMKTIRLVLIMFIGFGCDTNDSFTTTISSGTSFGECIGYCKRQLDITKDGANYYATAWSNDYPDKVHHSPVNQTEWDSLLVLVDMDAINDCDDVIGCPDCADVGAEWIQIVMDGEETKITFEYGDSLETIQSLIDRLRYLRDRYEKNMFP